MCWRGQLNKGVESEASYSRSWTTPYLLRTSGAAVHQGTCAPLPSPPISPVPSISSMSGNQPSSKGELGTRTMSPGSCIQPPIERSHVPPPWRNLALDLFRQAQHFTRRHQNRCLSVSPREQFPPQTNPYTLVEVSTTVHLEHDIRAFPANLSVELYPLTATFCSRSDLHEVLNKNDFIAVRTAPAADQLFLGRVVLPSCFYPCFSPVNLSFFVANSTDKCGSTRPISQRARFSCGGLTSNDRPERLESSIRELAES